MKHPRRPPLTREAMEENPVEQFGEWFAEAVERSGLDLPDAACLSTVDGDGYPDGRMVLLKDFDERGFVFYTNFESRKARSLRETPRAALTFYWERLRRQVRIQGDVRQVPDEEADVYFATRPRGSRIGAWASRQSDPVEDRAALDRRFEEARKRFAGTEVPRPPFWGGFRIRARALEFWQEGPDRLHDRFRYERTNDGWTRVRLQP